MTTGDEFGRNIGHSGEVGANPLSVSNSRELLDTIVELHPTGKRNLDGSGSFTAFSLDEHTSYIMVLDAKQLVKAYETCHKEFIFSSNIRNYLGNSKVNKEIIKTALNDPNNFFIFNNGISCLASHVNISGNKLIVKGLQIINGAQTVRALYQASQTAEKDGSWASQAPHVLVRITEIKSTGTSEDTLSTKITQYNNTQNLVKVSDFITNDDIHSELKEKFGQLTRFGKKVNYLSKRTKDVEPNTEIIKMHEYAKAIYTFFYNYRDFSSSNSFLYDTSPSGGYVKVFGDGEDMYDGISDEDFQLSAGIYWLSQEFSEYLKTDREREKPIDLDAWHVLENKWILIHAAADILKLMHPEGHWRAQVVKLYKGDWRMSEGERGQAALDLYKRAKKVIVQSYKNSKKFQKPFVHANWMKDKETQNKIRYNASILGELDKKILF